MEKAIITVVGKDQVGIIAKVCTFLSENNVNILDISQTILDEYFNMMMIVDIKDSSIEFGKLKESIETLGNTMNLKIKLQKEEIFNMMHRI